MNYTKLNVGSRDVIKPSSEGWLNIDIDPLGKGSNFLQMDVFDMPADWAEQFEEIQAIHVLEHINRNRRLDFVKALYRVTKVGGMCYIEVPNFQETIRLLHEAYTASPRDHAEVHKWTTSIYGKQRSPGDQHCWGFDLWTLAELGQDAGFVPGNWAKAYKDDKTGDRQPLLSEHYKQEPILLMSFKKISDRERQGKYIP